MVDNFARAAGENFTARQGNFTCGLARTSSPLQLPIYEFGVTIDEFKIPLALLA